tara:strand:- start:1528 stop:2550 length:1023 start_codon:yes stop_codon:yes gene_type:complete
LKIIVTGGSGFIGSNFIANQTTNTNNKILNIDNMTYAGNYDNDSNYRKNENYSFVKGDICNKNFIRSTFERFSPDIVVNFAAESHVDRSIDSPKKFLKTNIMGTLNLLNASLSIFKKNTDFKFIHISTDEVYGSLDKDSLPFIEESPYKPNSPYAASKAGSDHLVRSWYETYNLPSIITNCSNNYGPYQNPEKLIPMIITNCIDEKKLPIYGDGENIRDWIFVNDHCRAINKIIENGKVGNKYVIGGNNEVKNLEIVRKICSIFDKIRPRSNKLRYKDLIIFVKDRPGHDFRYAVNASKIQNELNWKPRQFFDKGLEFTIKWYLQNESWWRKIQKKLDHK